MSAAVVAAALAIAFSALTGCGGSPAEGGLPAATGTAASPAVEKAGGTATPVEATPVTHTGITVSLHDRVMAEQGRGSGFVHVDRLITTPTAAGPHDATADASPATDSAAASAATDPTAAATDPAAAAPESTTTTTVAPPVDPSTTTNVVLADGQTPLSGVWSGTADRLASYLLSISPEPRFTVDTLTLAEYYVRYCAEAGLRADLLWAQMIHETGYGMYGGDVSPEQNNYAGIGATGGGAPGLSFSTAEAGVMAQVAHMVAYVFTVSPVEWANATTDPRFDFVNPRGAAAVLADLNGRWAVPGTSYGQNIEGIVRAINAL